MGSADYLYALCDTVLDASYDALSDLRTGFAPPSRVFVSHGPAEAQGCKEGGQLTVHLEPIEMRQSRAQAGSQMPGSGPTVPVATLTIRLFRCYQPLNPDGSVLTAIQEDEAAKAMMIDGWCLATGLWASMATGALASCSGVQLGRVTPLRSAGSYQGWSLALTVQLSDGGPE